MNGLTAASWIERFVCRELRTNKETDLRPTFPDNWTRRDLSTVFQISPFSPLVPGPASFSLIGGTLSFNVEWPPHLTRNSEEGGQMVPASRGIIDAV